MVHIKETIFTSKLKLSLLPKWRKTCIVIFRFYNKDFLFYGAGKKNLVINRLEISKNVSYKSMHCLFLCLQNTFPHMDIHE